MNHQFVIVTRLFQKLFHRAGSNLIFNILITTYWVNYQLGIITGTFLLRLWSPTTPLTSLGRSIEFVKEFEVPLKDYW